MPSRALARKLAALIISTNAYTIKAAPMPLTNAQKQAAHRARRDAKLARMQTALEAIAARLDGNTKPLAVEVHQIATEGLQ